MACEVKTWYTILLMLVMLNMMKSSIVVSEPQVPCLFIFGDSLFDNGNNNNLFTTAKANYPPYGIDFRDGKPSGRFTNGRNTADFIAELLDFDDYVPPFATAKLQDIMRGVNYASGAAGILDETALHQGQVISLNKQLLNHRITIARLVVLLGSLKAAKAHLNTCLYIVGMGNNDYINNYLLPQYYPSSHLYSPEQFATLLVQRLSQQLKTLMKLGARKVGVFGLGNLGFVPMYSANITAAVSINNAVKLANDKLKPLIDDLNNINTDAKFIFLNSTSISSGDPSDAGITVVDAPCCKVSSSIAAGQCSPGVAPCSNRGEYAFYDGFHPTEIANQITALRAYTAASPTDAYPFDITHLLTYSPPSNIKQVYSVIDFNRQSS